MLAWPPEILSKLVVRVFPMKVNHWSKPVIAIRLWIGFACPLTHLEGKFFAKSNLKILNKHVANIVDDLIQEFNLVPRLFPLVSGVSCVANFTPLSSIYTWSENSSAKVKPVSC